MVTGINHMLVKMSHLPRNGEKPSYKLVTYNEDHVCVTLVRAASPTELAKLVEIESIPIKTPVRTLRSHIGIFGHQEAGPFTPEELKEFHQQLPKSMNYQPCEEEESTPYHQFIKSLKGLKTLEDYMKTDKTPRVISHLESE